MSTFTKKHYNAIYKHSEKVLAICDNVDADSLRVNEVLICYDQDK